MSKWVMQAHYRHLCSKSFSNAVRNFSGFDPYYHYLKIRKSIRTLTPKVGAHLGIWGSFPCTLPHSREHEM